MAPYVVSRLTYIMSMGKTERQDVHVVGTRHPEAEVYELIIIIVFMMDPVGPMVQRNLNHKYCHFAPPCGAVYCQGLKVFQ